MDNPDEDVQNILHSHYLVEFRHGMKSIGLGLVTSLSLLPLAESISKLDEHVHRQRPR